MSIKSGDVVQGTVTRITNFGAFIKLEDDRTGLCHISEVSNEYVKDIHDFLEEGQKVRIKVMNIREDNKIELSIRALTKKSAPRKSKETFENMLNDFLRSSDEKLKNLKTRDQKF